jgi:hypothetical protein
MDAGSRRGGTNSLGAASAAASSAPLPAIFVLLNIGNTVVLKKL